MNKQELLEKIKGLAYIEIIEETEDVISILNKNTKAKMALKLEKLLKYNIEKVIKVINGEEAIKLDGITRIVGYFSKTKNWNKSKKGELKDRQQGDYCV